MTRVISHTMAIDTLGHISDNPNSRRNFNKNKESINPIVF